MIEEDYVSFETAKLLKEKGFDEKCYVNYNFNGEIQHFNYYTPSDGVVCPTLQMAMKWLREVHYIHIEVHLNSMDGIHPIYEALYSECVTIRTNNFIDYGDTYEEACEVAIKYCLTNLIK